MEHCYSCKININANTDTCPLCHKKLLSTANIVDIYPKYEPLKNRFAKTAKVISIIAPICIGISILLNLFVIKTSYWSVIAIGGIIYFWLLGLLTFNRKVHIQLKLIAHTITISIILILINVFAARGLILNRVTWAIAYGIPITIIVFISFINLLMFRTKQKMKEYLLYQFALCLIGFVPLIIIALGVAKPLFPSLITAIYSYCTFFYLILAGKNIVKDEFKKRFHI